MIKVINARRTANMNPPFLYSSWLEYWEKKTGNHAVYCACCGCTKRAEHGAHVRKYESFDDTVYIVPLCAECNNPNNVTPFYVDCILCKAV